VGFDFGNNGRVVLIALLLQVEQDVDLALAEDENLFERGDALIAVLWIEPASGIESPHLGHCFLLQFSLAVGCPVERGVVQDDQMAVLRRADIDFDCRRAGFNRPLNACQRALRAIGTRATVGDDLRDTRRGRRFGLGAGSERQGDDSSNEKTIMSQHGECAFHGAVHSVFVLSICYHGSELVSPLRRVETQTAGQIRPQFL
jgi:hypothetical protein